MSTTPTPPENRIAGKRFYIAATYSDKQAREELINTIMRHGGASVGHWLSADYYVSVNYKKPMVLGCTVLNVRTLLDEWIPEAQRAAAKVNMENYMTNLATSLVRTEAEVEEARRQKLIHMGRQIGKTEMTQQAFKQSTINTMSVDNKLDAIIHLLTDQTRLEGIEEALTQITNQLNLLSTVTVASTRPAQLTDDPVLNDKLDRIIHLLTTYNKL